MQGVPRRFTWYQYKPKKTATELDKPKADAEFEKGNLSLCHSLIWDWQRPGNSSLPVNLLHWDGEWGKWNKSLRFSHTSPDCYQGQHLFALSKQLGSSGQGSVEESSQVPKLLHLLGIAWQYVVCSREEFEQRCSQAAVVSAFCYHLVRGLCNLSSQEGKCICT